MSFSTTPNSILVRLKNEVFPTLRIRSTNRVDRILREIGLPVEQVSLKEIESFGPPRKMKERGQCGKVMYPSESSVQKTIKHLLSTKKGNASALRSYFCDTCKAHHVTSSFFVRKTQKNTAKSQAVWRKPRPQPRTTGDLDEAGRNVGFDQGQDYRLC